MTGLYMMAGTALPVSAQNTVKLKADVWADNWFALYLDTKLLKQDSVPITTERSFNAETFTFSGGYPLQLNFVLKDFKQNDTGLEYIGTRRQQMGDGGLIAQFTDLASGKVVGATSSAMRCLVVHQAPLDKSCARERDPEPGKGVCQFLSVAEPAGWKEQGFDDSDWPRATVYSARAIRPKGGYDKIRWDRSAKFIWSGDLETDNTVLCRLRIDR
ncbi:PEBP family protein [Hoeflea sp. TYP-13]|uniref:PEBP family protein n=1 Tax=Hoeflea sp. TYP-13 TaxID=3230023 RepID=UPI0034C5D26B